MRSHESLLPCGALEWVASRRPDYSTLCTLRGQGHSFSDSHRLQRAWQKDMWTVRAPSQGTTSCSGACRQPTEPIGTVPRLGKRPKTLIGLLTSLHYQSLLLSLCLWWCASSSLSLRRSNYVPSCLRIPLLVQVLCQLAGSPIFLYRIFQ